ncbi:unnamed protein product [Urochloa decumbens]|uniref:Polygalacturonase n=1 Tax=Urochloa decumbens TaxID=240449 RepID=A0ABC9DGH9_9POAL
MKRRSIPNASSANATLLLALLLLVTTSPSFLQHCVARRESHHRPPPAGRHHPPPPAPVMPPPPAPVMPPPSPPPLLSTFSVLDYGAVGDGTTDDTKAFAAAWSSACAAGASTVLVPVSYVFLVGPITFTGDSCVSNMVFQVDGTILADAGSTAWRSGVVMQWLEFKNVRGLTIQGCGTVDGQGSHWWSGGSLAGEAKMVTEEKSLGQNLKELDSDRVGTSNRPTAVRVFQSASITVTGITIRNSPRFHLTFDSCHGVEVHDVAVSSPGDSPNTDGIHLAGSVGVSIHHTTIACGRLLRRVHPQRALRPGPRHQHRRARQGRRLGGRLRRHRAGRHAEPDDDRRPYQDLAGRVWLGEERAVLRRAGVGSEDADRHRPVLLRPHDVHQPDVGGGRGRRGVPGRRRHVHRAAGVPGVRRRRAVRRDPPRRHPARAGGGRRLPPPRALLLEGARRRGAACRAAGRLSACRSSVTGEVATQFGIWKWYRKFVWLC